MFLFANVNVDQKYQIYLEAECRVGMGWNALATNFAGAVDGEVCGMCLTAAGTVWGGNNTINFFCQIMTQLCLICSPL
jgi:hypothetical protein